MKIIMGATAWLVAAVATALTVGRTIDLQGDPHAVEPLDDEWRPVA